MHEVPQQMASTVKRRHLQKPSFVVSLPSCSHDSDAGSNLESLLVGSESDISLLLTVGADEGVNSGDLDFVEVLAGALDDWLLCAAVTDEHEGVVLLNGLDGRLTAERELDDTVGVESLASGNSASDGNRGALLGLGNWASESNLMPHLPLSGVVDTFLHISCDFLGLRIINTTL